MKISLAITVVLLLAGCDTPPGATEVSNGSGSTATISIIEKDGHRFAVAVSSSGSSSICEVTAASKVQPETP